MNMKIAFASSSSGGLEDTVSPVFGRARTFTIVELENGEIKNVTTIENPAAQLPGGAGIQTAQFIAEQGVTHVVAGNFGPNSSMILAQMGIEMIRMEGIKIKVDSENEKLVWLAQNIHKIPGTGIIYTGTQRNTDLYLVSLCLQLVLFYLFLL